MVATFTVLRLVSVETLIKRQKCPCFFSIQIHIYPSNCPSTLFIEYDILNVKLRVFMFNIFIFIYSLESQRNSYLVSFWACCVLKYTEGHLYMILYIIHQIFSSRETLLEFPWDTVIFCFILLQLLHLGSLFILQEMCWLHSVNAKVNKEHLPNIRNRQPNLIPSVPPSLSRAELVVQQTCKEEDEDAIIIKNGIKHLITSPGFPDPYPRKA